MAQEPPTTTCAEAAATQTASDLETVYREALARFKADKSNKDLRRARTAAKKAWDEAVLRECRDDGAKALHCKDCSQMFLWTSEEQEYYASSTRNWMHQPLRCRACAESQKKRRANSNINSTDDAAVDVEDSGKKAGKNMCYAFQRGECRYGDKCKFNHDPNFAGKNKDDDDDDDDNESRENDSNNNAEPENGTKKRKGVPNVIAICKWGKNCTIKKCRYRHFNDEPSLADEKPKPETKEKESNRMDNRNTNENSNKKAKIPTGICKWGKNCTLKRCRLQHIDNEEGGNSSSIPPSRKESPICVEISPSTSPKEEVLSRKSTNKDSDKTVIKAMRKALKKAPKKQLKVKELRKLICSTKDTIGKDEAKIVVKETIAKHTDKLVLLEDGKVVQWIQ